MQIKENTVRKFLSKKMQQLNNIVADLDTLVTEITTTGADAFTLANGVAGQVKIISMAVDGGDATLTPTTLANGSTITFNDANDSVTMIYGTNGWQVLALQGAIVA